MDEFYAYDSTPTGDDEVFYEQTTMERFLTHAVLCEMLYEALDELSDVERGLMVLKYGLTGFEPVNTSKLATIYNPDSQSLSTIQYFEQKAFKKIRHYFMRKGVFGI